jgi:hypothetical protein
MKKTYFLLSFLARILFAFLSLFDLLLVARISRVFATHGVSGVKCWILHAGLVGTGTTEPSGPGLFVVHFPPSGPIFREFFLMCGVLVILTPLSFWLGRWFGGKARQATQSRATAQAK